MFYQQPFGNHTHCSLLSPLIAYPDSDMNSASAADAIIAISRHFEEVVETFLNRGHDADNVSFIIQGVQTRLDVLDWILARDQLLDIERAVSQQLRSSGLEYIEKIKDRFDLSDDTLRAPKVSRIHTGERAQPKIMLDMMDVNLMRRTGRSWNHIAEHFKVDPRTVRKRFREQALPDPYALATLTDEQLDEQVLKGLQYNKEMGEVILFGMLKSKGYRVPLPRIRESRKRVDPRVKRNHVTKTTRRVYSVPGPLSLVHIDGKTNICHHKN